MVVLWLTSSLPAPAGSPPPVPARSGAAAIVDELVAEMGALREAERDAAGSRLTIAALGFLWQLASRNPYAARLVSGASLTFKNFINPHNISSRCFMSL